MLPMPGIIKRLTHSLVDKVLFFDIRLGVMTVNLWQFCFLLSTAAFGFNVLAVQDKSAKLEKVKASGGKANHVLMSKWKSERDVWITGFALSLYM